MLGDESGTAQAVDKLGAIEVRKRDTSSLRVLYDVFQQAISRLGTVGQQITNS